MIFHALTLENFGIFGGTHTFHLTPAAKGNFQRPLTLLRGKNGSGKTTLAEAIRLCLHGPLVLGDRVSQQEYIDYLKARLHRNESDNDRPAPAASVTLVLDYVERGRKTTYTIKRSWQTAGQQLHQQVEIWADGTPPAELTTDAQKDLFLRELVPPTVADLFFFDGEKLENLTTNGRLALADNVKHLLGLNMAVQLQQDLDIYVNAQELTGDEAEVQATLQQVKGELDAAVATQTAKRTALTEQEETLQTLRQEIEALEQKILTEGGDYAQHQERYQEKLLGLERELDQTRKQIHELANGLLPFAFCPDLLQAVAQRLNGEEKIKQARAAEQFVAAGLQRLADSLEQSETLRPQKNRLLAVAEEALTADLASASGEIVLDVADQERVTLLGWIRQVQTETAAQGKELIGRYDQLSQERRSVQKTLDKVPPQEMLQPLVTALSEKYKAVQTAEQAILQLQAELEEVGEQIEQLTSRQEKVRQQLAAVAADKNRVQLATKTQQLLTAFQEKLTAQKIEQLGRLLLSCFNRLCQKEHLLDSIEIDPHSFDLLLYRGNRPFAYGQLSAGERQLLAIATLWALRELSGLPLPVLVDTPLARLDVQHRERMLSEFFPRVSHQVLLLATDAELDGEMVETLAPAVAQGYELIFDPAVGSTRVEKMTLPDTDLFDVALTEVVTR